MIKALALLMVNLPKILELLQTMQKHAEEQAVKRKLDEDIRIIEEAYKNKDSAALNKLFLS